MRDRILGKGTTLILKIYKIILLKGMPINCHCHRYLKAKCGDMFSIIVVLILNMKYYQNIGLNR